MNNAPREIPYNYTSADDQQALLFLLGGRVWKQLEELRSRRVTGRSARLLMRFFGDILIYQRNPFLLQELLDSAARRRRFFNRGSAGLDLIERNSGQEPRVIEVLAECRRLLDSFKRELKETEELRRRLQRTLGTLIGRENVLFDPFTLVSHATDATDWRLYLPLAVVIPTEEGQVVRVLQALADMNLHAIPRGAGTGLTGGCVPVRPRCVIVNTEKLNRILGIQSRAVRQADGSEVVTDTMRLEAGVITEHAMEHAAQRGLVFATDPTSAWAATIGGNIAENAGGKTSVLWGTAIDNILSYRLALPGGREWFIERVGHPLRKIQPQDAVLFEVRDLQGTVLRTVRLRGPEIRKPGLWKDITNKALGGLPAIQKEGTDGIITSAEFVLYPAYEQSATLCLEFFGADMEEASRVIRGIVEAFPNDGEEALKALEHFDDQYVRAIGYKVKAPRTETPKAVLLIDLVGHNAQQTERGVATIRSLLAGHANTCLFVARDEAEAIRFWQDRKKLGAIAARTNAFKLNEDIVLPLSALADFARFIDRINIEEERFSQQLFTKRAEQYLQGVSSAEDAGWLREKVPGAVTLCSETRARLPDADDEALRSLALVRALLADLLERFRGYEDVESRLRGIFDELRVRLLVAATHMHAGDGNVHVNIPILSNDRPMMKRADLLIDRIMARVKELGGVVSGEHGIGITKLKYLEPERITELDRYRNEIDPKRLMNPGKLADLGVLDQIFTPSFNLLELEARILQHGSLEQLALRIAQCVRCGRCKPNCCVFHPPRGLFYHPRNKNLAIGSLIEALLYDAQRERSTGFELLRYLEDVADHCTICHKCLDPCPVRIDTGEVSVLEREILTAWGYKHSAVGTRLLLRLLDTSARRVNQLVCGPLLQTAAFLQRTGVRLGAPLQRIKALAGLYPLRLLRSPLVKPDPGTLRDVLPPCEPDHVLVIEPGGEVKATVFYFPGCGSERFFSHVSLAALHVLAERGARVVLPPPFLCCGFPAYVNAKTRRHDQTVLRDTILFSQIREMFRHLRFDACIVTCGTCREALEKMEMPKIFGCQLTDLARFALEQGLHVEGGCSLLYHAPCHDSLGGRGAEVLAGIGRYAVVSVPHCCSEAGTLALSRPDIADNMLDRKRAALRAAQDGCGKECVVLTNCPSCLQGLGRNQDMGIVPRHIAVELALQLSGEGWIQKLMTQVASAQAIRF